MLRAHDAPTNDSPMSDANIEFVRVYDFATGEITTIPASELAAGMVRICLDGSDEILWADSAQLKPADHRHPPFVGALREKILYIEQSLADVYSKTYEDWEDGFRRDMHPDQEIDLWVHVCRCLGVFVERHSLAPDERQEAFWILAACLNSTPSTVFEIASVEFLGRALAQELVDAFFCDDSDA